MNRRGLLKLMGLAPVALPMFTVAASTPASSALAPIPMSAIDVEFLEARRFAIEEVFRGFMSINEARALEGLPPC